MKADDIKIAVIGLGYVGLPLAAEFSKKRSVLGFDINEDRINDLKNFHDKTLELSANELSELKNLEFTNNPNNLQDCNFFIVTVPTPISKDKEPDLNPIIDASNTISSYVSEGNFVVFESTVFPGVTEDICIPLIEEKTGLKLNKDLFAGYSPERINPGDKIHSLTNITKITSGSNEYAADVINELYASIITAGTYKAPSIKIAEAAKVIENTQRDLNIALVNELSKIFDVLQIDTKEVLKAAETKWNFLPFRPGLVGGHCIGVDPYYLTYKAKSIGYEPNVILAGREINDNMGNYVALEMIKRMKKKNIDIKGSKILIMGLTFKENCADIRNSGVKYVAAKLREFNCDLDFYDPWADSEEIKKTYGEYPKFKLNHSTYDGIIIAVAHEKFKEFGVNKIVNLCKKKKVIYDLKYLFSKEHVDLRL